MWECWGAGRWDGGGSCSLIIIKKNLLATFSWLAAWRNGAAELALLGEISIALAIKILKRVVKNLKTRFFHQFLKKRSSQSLRADIRSGNALNNAVTTRLSASNGDVLNGRVRRRRAEIELGGLQIVFLVPITATRSMIEEGVEERRRGLFVYPHLPDEKY